MQVKFLLARRLSEEVYPSFRKARDSLLIDISNHCARIAVLHAKEARSVVNKKRKKNNKTGRHFVMCIVATSMAEICRGDSATPFLRRL